MKTFVEIHVLQNFAPSNLNRDDTGLPKMPFSAVLAAPESPASASNVRCDSIFLD